MRTKPCTFMVLSALSIVGACVSGEPPRRSDAEVAARDYVSKNCKKFDLDTARVSVEDYGNEIVVEFLPGNIEEKEKKAKEEGYIILDPEIIFLFKKKPLEISMLRGCRKYA